MDCWCWTAWKCCPRGHLAQMKIIGEQASTARVYAIIGSSCRYVRLFPAFAQFSPQITSVVPEGVRIDFRFRRLSARTGSTRNSKRIRNPRDARRDTSIFPSCNFSFLKEVSYKNFRIRADCFLIHSAHERCNGRPSRRTFNSELWTFIPVLFTKFNLFSQSDWV